MCGPKCVTSVNIKVLNECGWVSFYTGISANVPPNQSVKTCDLAPTEPLQLICTVQSHVMPVTVIVPTPCGVNFSCILSFVTNGRHNLPYQCQPKVSCQWGPLHTRCKSHFEETAKMCVFPSVMAIKIMTCHYCLPYQTQLDVVLGKHIYCTFKVAIVCYSLTKQQAFSEWLVLMCRDLAVVLYNREIEDKIISYYCISTIQILPNFLLSNIHFLFFIP